MTKTKILTDGSVRKENNIAVSAYVIKKGDEKLASDLEVFNPPNYESEYAEARGIRLGINKALEMGIKELVVATDNRNVADALKVKYNKLGRYGDIRMIKKEVEKADSFRIFHVPRSEVREAHELCNKYHEYNHAKIP